MIRFKMLQNNNEGPEINMMPLIDIIFNLLIFFMITAAATTRGMDLSLPEAESSRRAPAQKWEILINSRGEIFFNEAAVSLDRLKEVFARARDRSGKGRIETIVVSADRNVPFGIFISVMDTARSAGFQDIVVATKPLKGGGGK